VGGAIEACFSSEDHVEGQPAFLEKGAPRWRGAEAPAGCRPLPSAHVSRPEVTFNLYLDLEPAETYI
jgi:hypothetical protein